MTRKKTRRATFVSQQQNRPPDRTDLRKQGLRDFQAGWFDRAIEVWSELASGDVQIVESLAEAHFRRSLNSPDQAAQIADMQRAIELATAEVQYHYLLGVFLHRAGDIPAAIACYRTVLQHREPWPGAGMLLALAELERNPNVDITALPGGSPDVWKALAPVQALLRGAAPALPDTSRGGEGKAPEPDPDPMADFWAGLGLVQAGHRLARTKLSDRRPLPSARADAIREYYEGVAAARAGDMDAALDLWQKVPDRHQAAMPWLTENLAAVLIQRLGEQIEGGKMPEALATATMARSLPTRYAALDSLVAQVFDRAAHSAAEEGDWRRAASLWDQARELVASSSSLGTPRLLLHNLALAYEAQEDWLQAAEMWRALLRTRPRQQAKKSPPKEREQGARAAQDSSEENGSPEPDASDGPSLAITGVPNDSQWAWVRKQVIECYRQAGKPEDAITIFRQAIKKDPDDIEMRLQLSDALLANEQEQAASNELQRILERDPQNVDALVRQATLQSSTNQWHAAEETLRKILHLQPDREDVRREVARLILKRGQHYHQWGMHEAAVESFEEGQQFAPDNYQFPLNLARVAVDQKKFKDAALLLDRVLEMAPDQPDAYVFALDCWTVANKVEEARSVLAQAEARLTITSDFYVQVGALIADRSTASPSSSDPLALLLGPQGEKQKPAVTNTEAWVPLIRESFERAIALEPDTPMVYFKIAMSVMAVQPGIAVHYAGQGVEKDPENPRGLATLGITQALNDEVSEAKKTLSRAIRLARRQGDMQTARDLEGIRREMSSPFFRFAFQMGSLGGDPDDDFFL
ncbi:MAG: tetratricopeptide repeat protein [Chloroflexaceae bacterium]|nr:tetratricopeptide repeat protein [Chloroflexaceae bacterium]